jgi:hypothetical protein
MPDNGRLLCRGCQLLIVNRRWGQSFAIASAVKPAELKQIARALNRDSFPPRWPSALGFGQHEVADIDVVPIFGQWMGIVGVTVRRQN